MANISLRQALLWSFLCSYSCAVSYSLTLLHTNDVHSEFEQFNIAGMRCSDAESARGNCFGGVARRYTAVERVRARSRDDAVLLVDAGDAFRGTDWFEHYKGSASAHFMNLLRYDAMAVGNHELDEGVDGLLPFLEMVNFPVLSCNMDLTAEPRLEGMVLNHTVKNISGESVGIIGYITSMVPLLAETGDLRFEDEATSVQREVDKLQAAGINKIIAVSHSGYGVDIDVAKAVSGIDVIVGGHTTTFLYTGSTLPPYDASAGPYPTVVQSEVDPSHETLIVTAYIYAKYLGRLHVEFDENGTVTSYGGNPILLDSNIPEDDFILHEISKWRREIPNDRSEIIGHSFVQLPGKFDYCQDRECALGNLVADAIIWRTMVDRETRGWTDVGMAMVNSGSIRSSLDIGDISAKEAEAITPFNTTIVKIELSGRDLLKALEQSVERVGTLYQNGAFTQVSGLQIRFNFSQPAGSRVSSVLVRCTDCLEPHYDPLDRDVVYPMLITSFMMAGGDAMSVFHEHAIDQYYTGVQVKEALKGYIGSRSPIIQGIENRVVNIDQENQQYQ